jgi:hypothetical protein
MISAIAECVIRLWFLVVFMIGIFISCMWVNDQCVKLYNKLKGKLSGTDKR